MLYVHVTVYMRERECELEGGTEREREREMEHRERERERENIVCLFYINIKFSFHKMFFIVSIHAFCANQRSKQCLWHIFTPAIVVAHCLQLFTGFVPSVILAIP